MNNTNEYIPNSGGGTQPAASANYADNIDDMKICPRCNSIIADLRASVCPFCGQDLNQAVTMGAGTSDDPYYEQAVAMISKKFARVEDYMDAKDIFDRMPTYKDSADYIRICDEKILEHEQSIQYYEASCKIISAREMVRDAERLRYDSKIRDAIVLVQDAKRIYNSILKYQDAPRRVKECEDKIREYNEALHRLNADSDQREKNRQKKAFKNKMKIAGAIIFGLIVIGMWAYVRFFNS